MWLLMVSTLINYFLGLHLARGAKLKKGKKKKQKKKGLERNRKILLALSVAGNIGVLAVFKSGIGAGGLPMGISFYTFRILSYLFDVYRGEETKETSFLRLATYVTMFPQLLSGPIASYGEVREALHEREFSANSIQAGLKVFTMGLVFKVLLADRLGLLWREVQVTGFESISTPLAWIAAIAYSMKLYFDFYGYSLMAVGLGQMLGFSAVEFLESLYGKLCQNFLPQVAYYAGKVVQPLCLYPFGGEQKGRVAHFGQSAVRMAVDGSLAWKYCEFPDMGNHALGVDCHGETADPSGDGKVCLTGSSEGAAPSLPMAGDSHKLDVLCHYGFVSAGYISGQDVRHDGRHLCQR